MSAVLALVLRREFHLLEKLLLTISVSCSLLYLLTLDLQPYRGSVVIKALSIAPLSLLAFRVLKTVDGLIVSIALVFSCIGDVMLGLHRDDFFIFGLLAFLVTHLFYIWLFLRHLPMSNRLSKGKKMMIAAIIVYAAAMVVWLWSGLGAMRVPALVYLSAITLMCIIATIADFSRPAVMIGALLFLISDSLIALTKFKTAIPFSNYAIWLTYYLGQYLITLGFLREKLRA